MIVYLCNIVILLLFGAIFLWFKPSTLSKKLFCVLATTQWILLSGLRHISIGPDTYAYKIHHFDVVINVTWSNLYKNFINIIFRGASGKDPGYPLFEKLVQIVTINYQVFLLLIAMIFTISLGIWIYRNSSEPCISFLIYSCLFYSFFAITGHRQTIATALVVLIGYKFIQERKIWPFLLLVGIAFTIHKSAVAFIPFYFLANLNITKKYIMFISVTIPILFIFRNQVMVVLGNFMGYENFVDQHEGAGTWTFTSLLIIITLITIWKSNIMLKNNPKSKHYINALFLALAFVPLTFVDPSAMRVVQYYSLFIILLVPEIIKSFKKKDRIIIYYVASALLVVLFAKNNPQYLFFWQG